MLNEQIVAYPLRPVRVEMRVNGTYVKLADIPLNKEVKKAYQRLRCVSRFVDEEQAQPDESNNQRHEDVNRCPSKLHAAPSEGDNDGR